MVDAPRRSTGVRPTGVRPTGVRRIAGYLFGTPRNRVITISSVAAVLIGAGGLAVITSPSVLPLRPLADSVEIAPDGYQHVLVRIPPGTPTTSAEQRLQARAGATGGTGGAAGETAKGGSAGGATGTGGAAGTGGATGTGGSTGSGRRGGGSAVGAGTAGTPQVDLAALGAIGSKLDHIESASGGRVLAVLVDGSRVDITAGGANRGRTGAAIPAKGPTETPSAPPTETLTTPPTETPTAPPTATVGADAAGAAAVPTPLAGLASDPQVKEVSKVDADTWRVIGDLSPAQVAQTSGLSTSTDLTMRLTDTNDTYWKLMWALQNLGGSVNGNPATADADVDGVEANTKATGKGIIVGIVDSGIQPNHPDLPTLWHNTREVCGNGKDDDNNGYIDDCDGWDFVHNDNTPYDTGDDNNHGTHVSGTIAAIPNNGIGTAGLAPGVTLLNAKITANGSIQLSDAAKAIRYAVDNGAKVINASFGTSPGAPREGVSVLESAVAYAQTKGVLIAAAAGNDGVDTDVSPCWPADLPYDNVISVGASTATDSIASFSNYGATSVDLFAPGHYIASTVDKSSYQAMQGTSMATPHVVAAAANLLSQNPALTPAEVRTALIAGADKISAFNGKSVAGGRLNADTVLSAASWATVSLEASGLNAFVPDRTSTASLTIKAPAALFPTGSKVTWQATLLSASDDATYAVVNHPVTVDGAATTTDGNGQVLLGPAAGVDPSGSVLTGDGARVSLGTSLPQGSYALVVDVIAASDHQFAYGPPVAVFFTVGTAASPTPTATSAPGGTTPTTAPTTAYPVQPTAGAPAPTSTYQPQQTTAPGGGVPGGGGGGGTNPGYTAPPNEEIPWYQPPTGGGGGGGTAPTSQPTYPTATNPPVYNPGGSNPWTGYPTYPGTTNPGTTNPGTTNPGPTYPGTTYPGTGTGPVAPTATSAPTTAPAPGTTTVPNPGSSTPTGTGPVSGNGITILSIGPTSGPASGSTAVMIIGYGFPQYPTVTVGGAAAYILSYGAFSLTVLTPPGTPGTVVDLTVGGRGSGSVTLSRAFAYEAASQQPGTNPGTTYPGTTNPGTTYPGTTNPGTTYPGTTNPGTTYPGGTNPGVGYPTYPGATYPGTGTNPGATTAPTTPTTQPTQGTQPQQTTAPAPVAPTGPTGTTFRPPPGPGGVVSRGGIQLAPLTSNNPLSGVTATQRSSWRCADVRCAGVPLR